MEKKKLDGRTILVASALFIAIFAQVGFLGSVMGPIGQQHNIWGTDAKSGTSQPGSTISTPANITAWIDGVNYGDNWTWDTGEYDLYVKGDDWGVPADDAVKDGGWNGDSIYYFLDYDPMDYFLNISTTTSTFDDSAYEQVDMFFDTETYTDFSLGDTSLRGIKINEVVLVPGDGGNQYVILYDPAGELTEGELETNYYLEQCDPTSHDPNGPLFDFSINNPFVEAMVTPKYFYINLTGFTMNSDDELKLVWRNPGGSADNICNGTDVIVDRVEWGNYINYINPVTPPDDRDYDNTSMANYQTAPVSGEGLVRITAGGDTDNCANDFNIQAATPRPGPLPFTPDYIEIVDTPSTGSIAIPLTLTVGVGVTITGYAAAFNASVPGYYSDVSVTWTVSPTAGENATTNPGSGSSSSFWSGWVGGTVDWTAEYAPGITYTITITILSPTPDSIEIVDNSGTGLTEIPDQGVLDGVFITGYAAGYNATIGYYGDVSVTWSVIAAGLQDADTNPKVSTDTSTFNSGTVAGQVHWLAEFLPGINDTVVIDITVSGGTPGFPTDLRVHKGGGAWGGIAGDLVLEWLAPTDNYGFLVANIVYYDMDLTDGFQYTTYVVVGPNATGAGTADGCLLPGWDANPNNYAFIVRTTGDVPGGNENLTGTNIGYKYIMTLQKNPGPGTQFMWISLPYYSDYTKAEDICSPTGEFSDNTVIDTLVKWNFANQDYDRRQWADFPPPPKWFGNFTINPGDALGVIVTTDVPYDWSIVGAYDDTLQFTFQKNVGPGTQFMTLSLPWHKSYINAADIADTGMEFPDNTVFDTMVQWNFASQQYDRRQWADFPPPPGWQGNFTINITPGDALGFIVTTDPPVLWTPQVITL
jgi:hypothetical protein